MDINEIRQRKYYNHFARLMGKISVSIQIVFETTIN